jgi:hypothetical protein
MPSKSRKHNRPPRIRVPNSERALFVVEDARFLGVIQRLSLSGGSAILTKGPIERGTRGVMNLQTVFGKVTAQVEFLQTGADGIPLAQAFRFVSMSDVSEERFRAAAKKMEREGFGDIQQRFEDRPVGELASEGLSKLRESIRRISGALTVGRKS